ncbi:hypothetical protein EDD86DRAFT_197315 [Gorgonomyces haynaldii]|nr:hypothetical protein EDD86DRAFT_197315 [Gorgonomyces haynaldii]
MSDNIDPRGSLYVLIFAFLLTTLTYVLVETLRELAKQGQLSAEWQPYCEFLDIPYSIKKPTIMVEKVAEAAQVIQETVKVIQKHASFTNVLPVPEQQLNVPRKSIQRRLSEFIAPSSDNPSMFIRKRDDELEKIHPWVAVPFRAADYSFDLATDVVAASIKWTFWPVTMTVRAFKKKPIKH